jgi:hypothetical protein
VVVALAVPQPLRPLPVQAAANAGLAHVDALRSRLECAVAGEQARSLVPQLAIDGVAVRVLKIGDVSLIVEQSDALGQAVDALGEHRKRHRGSARRDVARQIRDWLRDAGGVVMRRDRHAGVSPSRGGVGRGHSRFRAEHADLPHAVVEDVPVLVDAAVPGG